MQNESEMMTETQSEITIDVENEAVEAASESIEAVEDVETVENVEASDSDTADAPSESVQPSEMEPDHNSDTDELTALRDEISSLRAELESRDRALSRMHDEISEFSELYPDRVLTSLPSEVWDGVRSGLPLAASVAFYEAKQRRREAIAAEINQRNSEASSGSVDGADIDYYSPDEVRAMNAAQVRQNYSKILDSMKLWN